MYSQTKNQLLAELRTRDFYTEAQVPYEFYLEIIDGKKKALFESACIHIDKLLAN